MESEERASQERNAPHESRCLLNEENNDSRRKIPYPKRVFFIIGNEFCERFNYYGLSAILVIYLKYKLGYSENDATVLFHGKLMLTYAMCFFGGVISDVWLGKFRTILYLSIVYSFSCAIISISSIPTLNLSPKICLITGLVLIAVGSGGIKPCVSAFGGDQFKLPEQKAQMTTFFSLFYFTINVGALLTIIITPVLREDIHCFGGNDCYPIAFGTPSILMVVAILFFLAGKSSYTYVKTSSENMLVRVMQCITHAISTKIREVRRNPRKNLLDYSIDTYGEETVADTRALLRILVLYLPLPLIWASLTLGASRWVFQADKMNGDIGFYTIKPDQIHFMAPLLVIIFIPLFETFVYPILHKIGIKRPLQKMTTGGILAAMSALLAALVEVYIESSPKKSVSMLWLAPQYVVVTGGEVMFSVTGLAFSYEQAPEKMKSVVQSLWQLTVSFGNLVILCIAHFAFVDSQTHEFLLYFGLTFVDSLVFIVLAYNFKNNTQIDERTLDQVIPLKTLKKKDGEKHVHH